MGFRERARRASAARRFHLIAGVTVGLSLLAIATAQTLALGWQDGRSITRLTSIYGGAGAVGTVPGSWAAAWLGWRGPRAFAAWTLLVGTFTMGLGALAFALAYRSAFSQWHAEAFTADWALQSLFTMVGALYFWLVLGTRMILPWAIVPLVVGGLVFARRSR